MRMVSRFNVSGEPFTDITMKMPPLRGCSASPVERPGWLAHLGGEIGERGSEHAVERGIGMDHVGQLAERAPGLDREDELAEDLTGPRRDQGGADEHTP